MRTLTKHDYHTISPEREVFVVECTCDECTAEREGLIPAPEIEEINLLRLVAENEDIDFRL